VLSQFSFVLDVAYMTYMRHWYADQCVNMDRLPLIYMMVDSSPISGFDWENTIFSIIGAADIVEVFDSCQLLVRAALNRQTLDDDDATIPDMLADESELMQAIADSIMIHHCPPVGLGAKRTNVKHRLQAFYHQMYLETGSSYLMRRVLNSIETCTGDLGTESGFPSAPSIAFASALPYVQNNDDDDDGDDLAAAQVSLDLHGLFVFQGVV
jgi:hypothetical protein